MSFIVAPNPDIMMMNMGKVAEYDTLEQAKAAVDGALNASPQRIFTIAEKVGTYTGSVVISAVDDAPAAPQQ